MKKALLPVAVAILATLLLAFHRVPQEQSLEGARFTSNGQMLWPEQYPKWVHVGSGLGMTYMPVGQTDGASNIAFTNVYVNPLA